MTHTQPAEAVSVKRYSAMVQISATPDGVSLADPELRTVVLASDHDAALARVKELEAKYQAYYQQAEQIRDRLEAQVEELKRLIDDSCGCTYYD